MRLYVLASKSQSSSTIVIVRSILVRFQLPKSQQIAEQKSHSLCMHFVSLVCQIYAPYILTGVRNGRAKKNDEKVVITFRPDGTWFLYMYITNSWIKESPKIKIILSFHWNRKKMVPYRIATFLSMDRCRSVRNIGKFTGIWYLWILFCQRILFYNEWRTFLPLFLLMRHFLFYCSSDSFWCP